MKTFIAYAVVALGLPVWVGHLLSPILNLPVTLSVAATRPSTKTPDEIAEASAKDVNAWFLGPLSDMLIGDIIAHASLDILMGFGALLLAGILFHFLNVHLSVIALLVLGCVGDRPYSTPISVQDFVLSCGGNGCRLASVPPVILAPQDYPTTTSHKVFATYAK